MNTLLRNQVDPASLTPKERKNLDRLSEAVADEERPCLMGREGVRIDLPDAIFHVLVRVIRLMQKGQKIFLFPEDETFTTQAAANLLGVSRPFLIGMLERGEIPFHSVGKHRRIAIQDLKQYSDERDQRRRATLDRLSDEVIAAGVYDATG